MVRNGAGRKDVISILEKNYLKRSSRERVEERGERERKEEGGGGEKRGRRRREDEKRSEGKGRKKIGKSTQRRDSMNQSCACSKTGHEPFLFGVRKEFCQKKKVDRIFHVSL
jgi:hypothetical protein